MTLKTLVAGAATALALIVPGNAAETALVAADQARPILERLSGTYESVGPEQWYGAFGHRSFRFDDGRWSLDFTFGFDPALDQKVFTFSTEGPYALVAPSEAVPQAHHTVFFEDVKRVTLHIDDPELVAQMGMADCGLEVGVSVDISETGCANWKPVAECGEDHDLFALDTEGRLYFGVRPADNDMCTPDKVPGALLAPVAKR